MIPAAVSPIYPLIKPMALIIMVLLLIIIRSNLLNSDLPGYKGNEGK